MLNIKADLKMGDELVPCKIFAIGYRDDGYTSFTTAVALVNGKLEEYTLDYFVNVEETVE